MNQKEFNKKELYQRLLTETREKGLGYRFLLDEFKRNKWNLNANQAIEIANFLDQEINRILFYAYDLNILNVDNKTKKVILKAKQNDSEERV